MTIAWLATATAAVRVALAGDFSGLTGSEVVALTRDLETLRRQLAAVDVQLIAELDSRGVAGEFARSSTAELLVSEFRVSPSEAKARVVRARDLAPRRSVSGEVLEPLLPAVSAALSDGVISPDHVRVITDCLEELPPALDVAAMAVVESALVQAACHEHPAALRRTATMLLARLDPDGTEPREDEQLRRREVTLARNRDGSGRLTGRLSPEATVIWGTIIDTMSAPIPAENGTRDERSAAQRRHDALVEAGQRLLRSDTLPAASGVPVTILARVTLAELESGTGLALTTRGDLVSVRELAAMSSDAEIVPVVIDSAGAVLALGRTRRLASRAQRLALASRDGGCTFPDCDRPAAWTEVHHVIPWQDGGMTDLDNMCLLCRFHHRGFEHRSWQVRMSGGIPEWIPPSWLDPAQRPRRNRAHHPPDIRFDLDLVALSGASGSRAWEARAVSHPAVA